MKPTNYESNMLSVVDQDVEGLIKSSSEYKVELLRRAIQEYNSRKKYLYYNYEPSSPKHFEFHSCGMKIRINTGANRAGKTVCAAQSVIMSCLGEDPWVKLPTPCTWWVVGSTFKKVKDVLLPKFEKQLPMNRVTKFPSKSRNNEYVIEFDNGSKIIFKSQEEGVQGFTSASIHGALIDERIYNADIRNQLRMRVVDTNGYLIFTMDKLEDDDWTIELAKNTDYVKVFEFTIQDNAKHLPKGEIERLSRELDDIEQQRLMYGKYVERGLEFVFPESVFTENNYVRVDPMRGEFNSSGKIQPADDGILRIFKEPEPGKKYLISCDPSEGVGANATAIEVFDYEGEQCAEVVDNTIQYHIIPDLLAMIGDYYNKGLIVVENKHVGLAVINRLKDVYGNLYFDSGINYKNRRVVNFGIKTESNNKKDMICQTSDDISTNKLLIHSYLLYLQMKIYVKKENKYYGLKKHIHAELDGSQDDLVMALAFADHVLNKWGLLRSANREANAVPEIKKLDSQNIFRYYNMNGVLTEYSPNNDMW